MKKIKTNITLKNYKGETLKVGEDDATVGLVVSTILAGKTSNQTLAWQLGKKFATEEEVEVKAEDIVFLKKELEGDNNFTSIVIGQLIELIEG